jgi:hypothetical protein
MFELILNYADGSSWFAGAFQDMDSLNKWLNEEKTRSYWKQDTVADIVDKSV